MTTGAMAFRQGPDGHVGDADPGATGRRRPARPSGLIPVLLAVFLCLAAVLAAPVARAQQAPVVGTVAVQSKDIADSARFTGRVNAVNKVDILPRVDGFLLSLGFKEGQAVSDGQTLFEIEPDSYKAAITEIEGRIQAAEADKKLADIEVDRQQTLVGDQVAAENVLQQAQARQGQAAGTLQELQGELQIAKLNLSYTTITAPFDGRVGLTDMAEGAYVSPQSGTLVTVSSIDPIYVTFPVSESVFLDFTARQKARDTKAPLAVAITLANGRDYDHDGTIAVVDTQVQPGTDTILIRASFPNPEGLLRDGQLVRVTLTQDTGEDSLTIPAQALQRDQGGYFVLVVGDDGKVEKRAITFGRMAGPDVIVAGGLKQGEQVITEGIQRACSLGHISAVDCSQSQSHDDHGAVAVYYGDKHSR